MPLLLFFSCLQGDRPVVPNIAVVITDGESNVDGDLVLENADLAREAGIEMFCISIGE